MSGPLLLADLLGRLDDEGTRGLMLDLVDAATTGPVAASLALLGAVAVGVGHALGPGHGKLLVGTYLASSRGRPRDAVGLGVLVALMHTGSVLVLGLVVLASASSPGGSRLQGALSLLTGVAVTGVGVVMLRRQRRRRTTRTRTTRARAAPPGAAGSGPTVVAGSGPAGPATDLAGLEVAEDGPAGGEDHDRHHHHHELPEGVAPLSRAGVVALAAAGGLLPSPAALAVLVTAVALDRPGLGLAMVAAFGAGLAVTLTVVGLVALRGRDALVSAGRRRPALAAVAARIPLIGAVVVLLGGLVLTVRALLQL